MKEKENIMTNEITKDNYIDYIIAYEAGELPEQATLDLFQFIVDRGTAWPLQGHYARTADMLLNEGLISKKE